MRLLARLLRLFYSSARLYRQVRQLSTILSFSPCRVSVCSLQSQPGRPAQDLLMREGGKTAVSSSQDYVKFASFFSAKTLMSMRDYDRPNIRRLSLSPV
jgi:hypothetical protein